MQKSPGAQLSRAGRHGLMDAKNKERAMQFVVLATDKPGCVALREETRPEHRVYLRKGGGRDTRVLLAGPTLDADGDRMNGTLLIVEAGSIDDVARFVAEDPYSKAGLFAHVDIRPWQRGLGQLAMAWPIP